MKWCLALFAIATTPEIGSFGLAQHRSCPGAGEMVQPSATCHSPTELIVTRVARYRAHSATRERNSNDDHVRLDRYETNGYEAADEWAPAGYVEVESAEKELACRGCVLPAHLYLDPDPRPLRGGARSELHRRPRPGHRRLLRWHARAHRGPRRHRHRRRAVPRDQETERRACAGLRHLASRGSERHLCRRRMPPDARDPASGRTWTRRVDHRSCAGLHV